MSLCGPLPVPLAAAGAEWSGAAILKVPPLGPARCRSLVLHLEFFKKPGVPQGYSGKKTDEDSKDAGKGPAWREFSTYFAIIEAPLARVAKVLGSGRRWVAMNWDELAARIGREFLGPRELACVRHPRPGFSGAGIWRLRCQDEDFALRAWPESMTEQRLHEIHGSLQVAATLPLPVPNPLPHPTGTTWRQAGGRLWEVSPWLPGEADPSGRWNQNQLRAARSTLDRMHEAWRAKWSSDVGVSPSVADRLQKLLSWTETADAAGRQLRDCADPGLKDLLCLAWHRLDQDRERCLRLLAPWAERKVPRQRVLADAWAEHFLFTGNKLTGLVDFGGVRWDAVEVASARLIHSGMGLTDELRTGKVATDPGPAGMQADLLRTLLATASTAGLEAWLRWLLVERRAVNPTRAAERLRRLLQTP